MLNNLIHRPFYQPPVPNPNLKTGVKRSSATYVNSTDTSGSSTTPLSERLCSLFLSPPPNKAAKYSPASRKELGGKGMFLQRMQAKNLPVPPFKCVTARIMIALEQHSLDIHRLPPYLRDIVGELSAEASLTNIRKYFNALPPAEQANRNIWLEGLAQFVASDDYYQQVKDSEAARHIRDLRRQLDRFSTSQPVIVRSSGIHEDNYGDAQAGKYLSVVQEEHDVLTTCLKVMASAYRPEVCSEGIPQPMALIIQECVDCLYGGVAMSYQSFQNDTVRVEFTLGQPKGVVAGQSGNTPHRIDIFREDRKEEADSSQYFAGTISSHFILQKNNNGYSEIRIDDADAQANDGGQKLSDKMVSKLKEVVTELENLLFCPVDVEFAIDRQGRLHLLQVRPVTRLSGDMVFAMPIPEETLAIGEGISEGFCTGPLWLARQGEADSMPKGAIVVAHHAEQWMLEPEFLKRAGGFVLAEAGFNDHVAILMKQEKITLMRASEQFAALAAQNGQQATLACARFSGEPGAFIVVGDLTGKLASHRSLSSAVSEAPLAKAIPSREDLSPPKGTFLQVASGFQWLTDQNARLLAFFASGGGLDCLANPIKLSMSPQRSELIAKTKESVNRLVQGAEALLDGYGAFLRLAGYSDQSQLKSKREELPQLITRFKALKQTIQSGLQAITLPSDDGEEGQLPFRQWVAACHQLQSCLQALDPSEAEQVRSVHELIFALHKRFVEALGPVTLGSGQGKLFKEKDITWVDCTAPGNRGEKVPLLSPSGKALMEKLGLSGTVVIMDDALIVNLILGNHLGIIELLERAEGGKERTLRLKFSDNFELPDGSDQPGKLQRMWFLVQLLKAVELDINSDSMKLSCNAVAGEIIIECPRMTSTETMQDAFKKLINVLRKMSNLDIHFDNRDIFEKDQWSFTLLAQRLHSDAETEADRFTFQNCLFSMVYSVAYDFTPDCYQLFGNHLQQFIDHIRRLAKSKSNLREILMSDEIDEDTRRKLFHHLLVLYPAKATRLIEDVYSDLKGEYFVIKPTFGYSPKFYVSPGQPVPDHKEKVKNALLIHGLKYASQRVQNDKDVVLPTIAKYPEDLEFASEELKNDKDVVMASVTQNGYYLEHASPELRNNDVVVKTALAQCPSALEYASERFRSDKNIIQTLIADDIRNLIYASEVVLKDREYLLNLIEHHPRAFQCADDCLRNDKAFIRSAIQRNHDVVNYIPKHDLKKLGV